MKKSVKNEVISTTLSAKTKALLTRYCQARGVKINFFIEEAILEKLEELMDAELILERKNEPTVAWKKLG